MQNFDTIAHLNNFKTALGPRKLKSSELNGTLSCRLHYIKIFFHLGALSVYGYTIETELYPTKEANSLTGDANEVI